MDTTTNALAQEFYRTISIRQSKPEVLGRWIQEIKSKTNDPVILLFAFEVLRTWVFCSALRTEYQFVEDAIIDITEALVLSRLGTIDDAKQAISIADTIFAQEVAAAKQEIAQDLN